MLIFLAGTCDKKNVISCVPKYLTINFHKLPEINIEYKNQIKTT